MMAAPAGCATPPAGSTPESQAQALMAAVNAFRADNGLLPVSYNRILANAALGHSQDMSQNNFFSHTGSNGSTMQQRLLQAGYTNHEWAGELLAAGQTDPSLIVQQWSQSPAHRYVLLNDGLHEIGVGYVYDPNDQPNVRLDNGQIAGPFCFYWTMDGGYRPGWVHLPLLLR